MGMELGSQCQCQTLRYGLATCYLPSEIFLARASWLPQRPVIGNKLDAEFLQPAISSWNEVFGVSVSPGNGSFDMSMPLRNNNLPLEGFKESMTQKSVAGWAQEAPPIQNGWICFNYANAHCECYLLVLGLLL